MSSLPPGPNWQVEILYRYVRDPIGCMTPLANAASLERLRDELAALKPDEGKIRAANVGPASGVKMVLEARLS